MSTMTDDSLNVPFTIVEAINKETNILSDLSFFLATLSNINLKQTPCETLNIYVNIVKRREIEQDSFGFRKKLDSIYKYNYNLNLEFSNYLHEFNQSYSYEVICKEKVNEQKSKYLFGCMELRHEKSICFEGELISKTSNRIPKLYFYIRRLNNVGSVVITDEKIQNVISTFRNTGCDIVLDTKDGRLSTHSAILSQNSVVFQAMFSIKMKESQDGIVNMLEFEARVVRKMLDYLYTRQLGELEDMTESLFKLAHCYQLHDLCRLCEEYYIFNVKVDNDSIVEILKLSDVYELKDLKKCAMNFANRHEQELIKLASYREYLIQSVNLDNAVTTLLLAEKYNAADVKKKLFDFIKDNYQQMMKDQRFLALFESHGSLMKEIHVYLSN